MTPHERTKAMSECCYCGISGHDADNCPTTFTPIKDCEHKDADDGCCHHPKNMTPECHVGACPRLHQRIYDAWNASLPTAQPTDALRPGCAVAGGAGNNIAFPPINDQITPAP